MSQQSPMSQAIGMEVQQHIAAYHVSFLRRNGGVPINTSGDKFQQAVDHVNHLLQKGGAVKDAPQITTQIAQNAVDLLAVLNAQQHASDEAIKTTMALFTTLVSLPSKEGKSPEIVETVEASEEVAR